MRFFPHVWSDEFSDKEATAKLVEYRTFLSSLTGADGEAIRKFDSSQSLNDSFLDRLQVDVNFREVNLALISGDNQKGYALLTIRYQNAFLEQGGIDVARNAFQYRNAEIRYDEFDLNGDAGTLEYVHRFLLWPEHLGEFSIVFDSFEVSASPLTSRGYVTYGESFEIG